LNRLPPSSAPAKILIVDDHGIVRDGITLLLERHEGMRVVGCAENGAEAVRAAERLEPHVILMDLVLPDLSGIDAMARILGRSPLIRVVVMSSSHSSEHVYRALRVGARGYVVKDAAGPELVQAVKSVLAGGRYLSAGISALLGDGLPGDGLPGDSVARSPLERLSVREREVMHRTVAGASSAEIGRHLSVSPRTVDTYRSRLMVKLGVRDRSALIRFAIEHGLSPL
jgi:DNA-binding NarL/FixJ family response regulator